MVIVEEIMVSVICTAYNHEKYIRDALEGFVNQKTSFKYEVLVNDDASTDHTADILREYERKYPELIKPVYQMENQYQKGVRIMQNILVPKAQGKYLAFCEGDDFWIDENKLQKQIDFLESNPEYVACTHSSEYLHVSSGNRVIKYDLVTRELKLEDCAMYGAQSFQTSSLIVRKNVYEKRPDFTRIIKGVADYPDKIYYALAGKIWYIGDVMSVYRVGSEGSWSNRVSKIHSKKIEIVESCIKMLEAADVYSNHKYQAIFRNAIASQQYQLLIAKQDFKSVVKSREFFQKEDFNIKIRYYLYAYLPFVVSFRNRIREGK